MVVILPSRYTDRAFLPAAALAGLTVAGALDELRFRGRAMLARPLWLRPVVTVGALVVTLLACVSPGTARDLRARLAARAVNQSIVDQLAAAGMQRSRQVFFSDWYLYNLRDPWFEPFLSYGGWILLDMKFAAEHPLPTARTPAEWRAYFATAGVGFVVLRRVPETDAVIRDPAAAGLAPLFVEKGWYGYRLMLPAPG